MVDLGPGAGEAGGRVLYSGPVAGLRGGRGLGDRRLPERAQASRRFPAARRPVRTGRHRADRGPRQQPQVDRRDVPARRPLRRDRRQRRGQEHAGRGDAVSRPAASDRGRAGDRPPRTPSLIGSGDVAEVVFLDQSPLARSARSNPVTYLKAFDEIRQTFAATHEAKLRNYDAGRFSFNVEGGRCNTCQGNGFLTIDMQFLPDVMIRCPECRGTRYRPEILGDHLPGPEHRRGPRPDGARGVRLLPPSAQGPGAAPPAAGDRPRLPEARPAGLDALRRRGPAAQAGGLPGRSLAALRRAGRAAAHALPARRADRRLHPARHPQAARGPGRAGRARPFADRDRAQPRGHGLAPTGSSTSAPAAGDEGGRVVAEGTPGRRRQIGRRRRPARSWRGSAAIEPDSPRSSWPVVQCESV